MRRLSLFSSILVVFCSFQLVAQSPPPLHESHYIGSRGLESTHAQQYYEEAFQYEALGDYEQAIISYSQTLSANPNHEQARFNRALLWYEMGHFAMAKAEFDEVIARDYMDAEAYEMRGLALYQNNHFEEAIADFNQAFRLSGKEDLLLHRGVALFKMGFYKDALLDLDNLLKSNTKHAEAMAARGDVLMALERYQAAIAWFDRALDINEDDVFALSNRGMAKTKMEQYEDAIKDFESALAIQPNTETFTYLSFCYFAMGEFELAKRHGVYAMQYAPENPEAYYAIGLSEMELGFYEEAIFSFDVALEITPEQTTLLIAQANAYLLNDNYYSAIENCNAILDKDKNHVLATDLLRQAFAGLEQHNIELLEVEIEEPIFEASTFEMEESTPSTMPSHEAFEEDPYGNF